MGQVPEDSARIAELEADNRRLRRLLDQRGAPGELRHRLRSTMALLRAFIRRAAETEKDMPRYVSHLEDRMDALMRAQAAIDERGTVNFHALLADELLQYGVAEGERAFLRGPEIEFEPRAGQVLAMALHELVVNAIEHGGLSEDFGRVEIAWNVVEAPGEAWLTFDWKEATRSLVQGAAREGFGTEMLTQTLAYELDARTNLLFEDDGLRCTVSLPLTDRIGRLA